MKNSAWPSPPSNPPHILPHRTTRGCTNPRKHNPSWSQRIAITFVTKQDNRRICDRTTVTYVCCADERLVEQTTRFLEIVLMKVVSEVYDVLLHHRTLRKTLSRTCSGVRMSPALSQTWHVPRQLGFKSGGLCHLGPWHEVWHRWSVEAGDRAVIY